MKLQPKLASIIYVPMLIWVVLIGAFGQAFAQFEHAARDGPLAFQRLAATANQQDAAAMNHHPAHAYQRMFWVRTFHESPRLWRL